VNAEPPQLPARFGPFYLFDHIGQGGMAEIFLAKTFSSLGIERLCVIKRILPELSADANFGEMLIDEAKLCSNLSHANVVQTLDLGQHGGRYYIAMEYVEGFDLNRLLGLVSRARISLPLPFAIFIIIETLRGLSYAHRAVDESGTSLGIIHRDVSPTNVLISTEGGVKLCDFGIAKVTVGDSVAARIDADHIRGKVAYMSPEHVAGEEIDHRADLFAAGILLWELLSGRRLYKTRDEDETLRRAREAEVPPLEDRGFPQFELLDAIVRRALCRDPEQRFQNGADFIRALEDYLHSAGLFLSQLRFADFLMDNFGEDLMQQRRARERHLAEMLERKGELDAERPTSPPPPGTAARAEALLATFDVEEPESVVAPLPQPTPDELTPVSVRKKQRGHDDDVDAAREPPAAEPPAGPSEDEGHLDTAPEPVRSGEPLTGSIRLSAAPPPRTGGLSSMPWIVGGALALAALGGAIYWFLLR
jgi:serine/threonine-protein kinase